MGIKYKVLTVLMVVALLFIPLSCHQQQEIPPQDWVVANEAEFLSKCENCDITFEKACFGPYLSYSYIRKIGDAYVELDQITYVFNNETREFIDKNVHWRDDLPDELPPIISEAEALAIGGGTKAVLVYIDPESNVYAGIEPTPSNPCWSVAIYEDFYFPEHNETFTWNVDVIVVDAVTGEILGHGVPVP